MNLKLVCPVCLGDDFDTIDSEHVFCECCKQVYEIKTLILYGTFYVYRFINDDWNGVPFYVGKGSGARYKNTTRSKHIQSICTNWKWHPEIVKYCDNEVAATQIEKELKETYRQAGYPIIDGELEPHAYAQRRGIEQAKLRGAKWGRPKALRPDNWDSVIAMWKSGEITAVEAMRRTELKRTTFYKFVNEDKELATETEVNGQ